MAHTVQTLRRRANRASALKPRWRYLHRARYWLACAESALPRAAHMSFTPDWREGRKYESSVSPILRSYRGPEAFTAATFSSWTFKSVKRKGLLNSSSVAESGGVSGSSETVHDAMSVGFARLRGGGT